MYLSDYTIPEAEVIYQKAVIRGAWWFFGFMLLCIFVYFVVHRITQERMDARRHLRQMARIKATGVAGQAGFDMVKANQGQVIRQLQKQIALKDKHIEMLESMMDKLTFGDVAEKIRKEIEEDGKD